MTLMEREGAVTRHRSLVAPWPVLCSPGKSRKALAPPPLRVACPRSAALASLFELLFSPSLSLHRGRFRPPSHLLADAHSSGFRIGFRIFPRPAFPSSPLLGSHPPFVSPLSSLRSSTELTQLVCTDLDSLRSMVLSNVSRDRGMRAVLETLGALVALAWTAPRVGWLVGGMCLASGAVAFYVRSSAASSAGRASNLRAEAAGCAEETFAGIRVLRAFSGARVALKRWSSIAGSLAQSGRSTGNTRAALETANRGAVHVALLALYGGGSALVYRGDLPLATLMAALGYTYALVFSTQGVLQTIVDVRGQGSVFRDALRTLRDVEAPREPPACKGVGADHVPTAPTEVTFDDVTFAYPGASAPSVRGVSLTLRPGRVTALVGPSGSGKSTLAALLERAYEPSSGRLLVGGCDAACVSRGLWPLVVSPVPQDALLFDGTVEDNISMGAEPARVAAEAAGRTLDTPAAAHAASVAAAEAAGVQLETLDGGMQARVGVRGSRLSGGQRQRVAIARALRSSSPIVVLDEPTSALDAQAEATVAEAVARLAKNGRTVLLVAHRLSTVRAADEIVVLDRGRVVERGTHAQLARKEGLYASLLRASDATAAGTRDMTARA